MYPQTKCAGEFTKQLSRTLIRTADNKTNGSNLTEGNNYVDSLNFNKKIKKGKNFLVEKNHANEFIPRGAPN